MKKGIVIELTTDNLREEKKVTENSIVRVCVHVHSIILSDL